MKSSHSRPLNFGTTLRDKLVNSLVGYLVKVKIRPFQVVVILNQLNLTLDMEALGFLMELLACAYCAFFSFLLVKLICDLLIRSSISYLMNI